jgi:hypothetical protein
MRVKVTQSDTLTVKDGPRVRVRIELTRAEEKLPRASAQAIPQPVEIWALIDCGAECSCVDGGVVRRLNLPAYKFSFVNAPALSGIGFESVREAILAVLHPSNDPNLELVFPSLHLTELDLGTLGYDALVGRDVLAKCVLTYNGPASSFTLSY